MKMISHPIALFALSGCVLFMPQSDARSASNENKATPVDRITAPEGFGVELLYSVPSETQGSWVNLCTDDKGRIIASDQFGGLYRFNAPKPGQALDPASIEKIPVDIQAANGLLWAFDALYVAVNSYDNKMEDGVYRVTDTDGDDQLDKVEKLRGMKASGDHGVHALLLSPDGESIFLISGNNADLTEVDASRVPMHWGEDHLLPSMPDGRGHNRGRLAPGGIIYKISPDGEQWELYSSGYRNIFDGGFNADGELFTYDADMEYDFNTPWYRPTRINHVTSGSMWGWRNGAGKRPEFYPDTLPAAANIGPGSPTGVTFGYGAKFPAKYQNAMFILDWSWGKVYAVHLTPEGATYKGASELFLSGMPLPVTDAIIHPEDGAMYFAIGGRKVQSGLYRVTYSGDESTAPAIKKSNPTREAKIRHRLEQYHGESDPKAVDEAWRYLDNEDRFVRWAARTAVQHQPVGTWSEKALTERNAGRRVEALLALAKVTGIDPLHRKDSGPPVNTAVRDDILESLGEVDWKKLNREQHLTLVRAYQIVLNRFGTPDQSAVEKIIAQLDPHFPAPSFGLNWLLCETLAFLQAPSVPAKAMALIADASTQEEEMQFARSIRFTQSGWTKDLRVAYFDWFLKASNYRGGASFTKFIEFIRNDAVASYEQEKVELEEVLARTPVVKTPLEVMAESMAGRSYVKEWELEELAAAADRGMRNRDFTNGRKMFAAAGCFACHRFDNRGGATGPDLSGAGGRYNTRDLLDQIINPSKEINEQFVPIVVTMQDGESHSGVVVNLGGNRVTLNTDLFNPNQRVNLDRTQVTSIEPAKISPMPTGLLNLLEKEEILDLLAYILSGGDESNRMFSR